MTEPTDFQRQCLQRIALNPGERTTAHVFNEVCGSSRTVRALFRNGWVQGDSIPAVYVSLTDAGRAVIANAETAQTNEEKR